MAACCPSARRAMSDSSIANVAAEMGISRQRTSKWVNRWRRYGEAGLLDQPSVPHHQTTATPRSSVGLSSYADSRSTPLAASPPNWPPRHLHLRADRGPAPASPLHLPALRHRWLLPPGLTHRARAFFTRHGITHTHRVVTDNEPKPGQTPGTPELIRSSASAREERHGVPAKGSARLTGWQTC